MQVPDGEQPVLPVTDSRESLACLTIIAMDCMNRGMNCILAFHHGAAAGARARPGSRIARICAGLAPRAGEAGH